MTKAAPPTWSCVLRGHPHPRDPGCSRDLAPEAPRLKVRVINVVDLMRLQPRPSTRTAVGPEFDSLFTRAST